MIGYSLHGRGLSRESKGGKRAVVRAVAEGLEGRVMLSWGGLTPKVDYGTGDNPTGASWADFDGDGKPDLAVSNKNSNTVSVLMNNGNGTFATRVDYAVGDGPVTVASGDFDGDGMADLAVGNDASGTVSVLLNKGNGTFAGKVDYNGGGSCRSVTSGDFNGDRKADLAVANYWNGTVNVLLNNGNGTFGNGSFYLAGSYPVSVTGGDFNGDGKADLAVANYWSGTVSVFLNNGNGTFAGKADYAALTTAYAVTVGDFNGDRKADLAVANYKAGEVDGVVSVLLNSGKGTFGARVDYAAGDHPGAVTSADFNGDGKADLAVADTASDTVSLLMNKGNGKFAGGTDYATGDNPLWAGSPDFNGDGKADLAVVNSESDAVSVLLSKSSFSLAPRVDYAAGHSPHAVTWGELNGDGTADLAVANYSDGTVSVLMNNGNGTFAAKVDYVVSGYPYSMISADFDGDGKRDLAVGCWAPPRVHVLMNNGNGTFGAKVGYDVVSDPASITAADLNGDGKADLATADSLGGTASVLLNNGNGTFAARVGYQATARPESITSADFNGDGKADLAVSCWVSNSVAVLMNNGNGTFGVGNEYVVGDGPGSLTSADFNGDGKPDLAVSSTNSKTVIVLLNQGSGTFDPGSGAEYALGDRPWSIVSADVNGDGKADLAVSGYYCRAYALLNNGNGTFAGKVDIDVVTHPYSIASADFNGDGKADLAVAGEGGVSVVLNRSTTVTINQAAWQVEPTGAAVIHFTAVFSNAVTGFSGNDVILEGTAGATTATVTVSGSTYDVAVSGMTRSGTVIVSIGEYAAEDGAGFWNSASTSTDNVVMFTKLISLTTPPVSGASVWRNQAYRIQWSGGTVGVSIQIWRRDGKGAIKLADAVPAELGYWDWDTSGAADGWYCFGAWVNPGDGGQWCYEASPGWVHVVNRGPVIALTTPAVATEINQGQKYSINWQASDPDGDPLHVALWAYSNGTGWFAIPGAEWLDASVGTFAWSTSGAKPGWYCFAGNVWDGGITVSGKSPNWLHVNGPKPTFAFVTPKNGQTSKFGSAFSIQWQATAPQGQNQTKVELWYCYLDWKDGNKAVWQRIAGDLDPVAGKYSWKTANLNPDYRWYSFGAWIGYGSVWVNVASQHWLRLV